MKTYTLKSAIRRGSLLSAAFALVVATFVPFASTHADALNPLTDRSLTLSSGSPGWAFTDGSGNTTYAQPNSGANGQKTGNTFEFKVSTDTTVAPEDSVKTMTFQYCTTSAGNCIAPGNNGWGATDAPTAVRVDNSDATIAAKTADLEIVTSAPSQISSATLGSHVNLNSGAVTSVPDEASTGNNFAVYYRTSDGGTDDDEDTTDDTWVSSDGWTMISEEEQLGLEADKESTGTNNQIKLTNATGQGFTRDQKVKVVFFATDANYITNPGAGAFFVKINTYDSATVWDEDTLVDGGVTVANVMNESIQITTKVLETMDFSVGTVDPYTLAAAADDNGETAGGADELSQLFLANGNRKHGICDPILKGMIPTDTANVLQMGDANGEFSLETANTYSTHSYWRLSSNSSAGATVYYSGVTLSNTVGDKIEAIGAAAEAPMKGSEQFGLALANGASGNYNVDYTVERGGINDAKDLENGADNVTNGIHASVTDDAISNVDANASWHANGPQLYPLLPTENYGSGAGVVNADYAATSTAISTAFAFDETSNLIPVAIASQDSQVVDCVTGKMRYIANIAATTPAGIYTTKINYIAAPQY